MGKVMIVDDELLVRIGLRSTISWQKYGFTIVADAANGQEAIKKFAATDPDILITDIRMPGMDGIELIKILKKQKPKLKTVILTNYDDFAYTQEALKLGADDYLLKSTLDNQTLLPILERLWGKVQQESVEDQQRQKLQKQALLGLFLLKKHFVESLISDELDEQTYQGFLQDLGLDWQKNNWLLILLKGELQDDAAGSDLRPLNLIEEITDKVGALVAEGSTLGEWILIYSFPQSESGYYQKKIIPFNIRQIQACLKQYLQIKTTAVFGSVNNCYKQLPAEYGKVREYMMYRFFWPEKQMIFPEDIPGDTKDYYLLESNDPNLSALIRMGDEKQVGKALGCFFNKVTKNTSPFLLRQFCQELYGEMARQCREAGIRLSKILKEDEQYSSHLENFQSIPAIKDWFVEKFNKLITIIKSTGLMDYSAPIREALIYIRKNYNNKDLNLSLVANKVGLSKNHFCTCFKEETGYNFVDFLHITRSEQAREMLVNSEMHIAEIAEIVGYTDPKYFAKVFQRYIGYSPTTFRKLCEKGGCRNEMV